MLLAYSQLPLLVDLPDAVVDGTTVKRRARRADLRLPDTPGQPCVLQPEVIYYARLADGSYGDEMPASICPRHRPQALTASSWRLVNEATQQAANRQARADSAKRADWHAPLSAPAVLPRKLKGDSQLTVIYQVAAPGGSNTADATRTDNRKAGRRQGSAAAGPGSTAGNASKRTAGPAWQFYLLVAVIGAAAWQWLSSKLPLGWLRWRARPG